MTHLNGALAPQNDLQHNYYNYNNEQIIIDYCVKFNNGNIPRYNQN